jgi:hypothetical protein
MVSNADQANQATDAFLPLTPDAVIPTSFHVTRHRPRHMYLYHWCPLCDDFSGMHRMNNLHIHARQRITDYGF